MTSLSIRTRLGSAIGHLYPFLSGCGTLANSRVMRRFDPPSPMDLTIKVRGGQMQVPSHDYVGRALVYMGDLDRKISQLVDLTVEPGDVGLDIGANLGVVSMRLAHRVGAGGMVHAFEPSPRLAPYLAATIAANPDLGIRHHPVALGQERAILPLHIPAGNAGAATLCDGGKGTDHVEVPVYPLTEYAVETGIDRADFIKIDVEGFEAQVLAGATDFLKRLEPKVIVLEEHAAIRGDALPPSLSVLSSLGFQLYALSKSLFRLGLLPLDHPDAATAHDYVALSPSGVNVLRGYIRS